MAADDATTLTGMTGSSNAGIHLFFSYSHRDDAFPDNATVSAMLAAQCVPTAGQDDLANQCVVLVIEILQAAVDLGIQLDPAMQQIYDQLKEP